MSKATDLLVELKRPSEDRRLVDQLIASGDDDVLIEALRLADDERSRTVLCDVLGFRHASKAVDALIAVLDDPSSSVRSSAADALAKIGDGRAGPALMARFELPEPAITVRRMLLAALGAVGYRPAIPTLIQWLGNPDPSQRGSAAWSLGNMRAIEAIPALEEAFHRERQKYPRERILEALRLIQRHKDGLEG